MYGIAVKPPFGIAIVFGGKDIENRTKKVLGDYQGDLVIYQSKTPDRKYYEWAYGICVKNGYEPPPFELCPKGMLLGVVQVDGVEWKETDSGWGMANHWQYRLSNPRAFKKPIVWTPKMGLGLLNIPDEVIK